MSNRKHPITITSGGADRGKGKRNTLPLLSFYKGAIEKPWQDPEPWSVYLKADPDTKAKKKAMSGWFKAATYEDNKRSVRLIEKIYAIQLDIDYATPVKENELLENLTPLGGTLHIVHTTRSHTPEAPRMRVLIPLSRGVSGDEAHAIARIVSQRLDEDPQEGLELCDPVSFRNNQIAYWPSISKGQPYWSELHDGDVLDADEVLAEVSDWTNLATLPKQSQKDELRGLEPNNLPEDPREKDGHVGAVCRAWDVQDANSEVLDGIYTESDESPGTADARWSYSLGTSSHGVLVYGDFRFIYSHQSSDPCGGKLCNTWDMIRYHRFGHLDDNAHRNTKPGNEPSQKAMLKWAQEQPEVRKAMLAAHSEAFEDYADDDDLDHVEESPEHEHEDDDEFDFGLDDDTSEPEEDDWDPFGDDEPAPSRQVRRAQERHATKKLKALKDWAELLTYDKQGALEKTRHNCTIIMKNDARIFRSIGKNDLTGSPFALRPGFSKFTKLPVVQDDIPPLGRAYTDVDRASLMAAIGAPKSHGGYGVDFTIDQIDNAVVLAAEQNRFNPVHEKIDEEEWDGVSRVETFFIDHVGAEDTVYVREAALAWFAAAAGRTYDPGLKFDYVPILEGGQGVGKSSMIRILAFDRFFGELSKDFHNDQRMVESLRGKWILEVAELSGFKLAEVEDIKKFFSKTFDTIRLAYRKNEEDFARRCVFMGSSNRGQYLRDPSGNRRFWPIRVLVEKIDFKALRDAVPQIWAEAKVLYERAQAEAEADGDELALDLKSQEAIEMAAKLQEEAREESLDELLRQAIQVWLDTPVSAEEAHAVDPNADKFDDDGGAKLYLRNVVSKSIVLADCDTEFVMDNRRNDRSLGSAISMLEGWEPIGLCRRSTHLGGTPVRQRFYQRDMSTNNPFIPVTVDEFGLGM